MISIFKTMLALFGGEASHANETLRKFEQAKIDQMRSRTMIGFYPASNDAIRRSDKAFNIPCQSFMFQSYVKGHRYKAAEIIYLHASATANFLLDCEANFSPTGASEAYNHISEIFLQILDTAIAFTPTDLLVLSPFGGIINFDEITTIDEVMKEASDREDECYHSVDRYESQLMKAHCGKLDPAGFFAFRRAMSSLRRIGLFVEEGVSPLALDFFPSLVIRENELIARRAELIRRPETADDSVIRF